MVLGIGLWIIIFVVSLVVMVKGADWFLDSSEKIGLSFGLSPFIVGVVIVGLGTSFPELISSLVAVFKGVTEIVTANAVGSNIANILLVIGMSAVVGKRLSVTKSLVDLDLPLFAISTTLFLGTAWDGTITLLESLLLVLTYVIYFVYTLRHHDDTEHGIDEMGTSISILPARKEKGARNLKNKAKVFSVSSRDYLILVVGVVALVLGAKYLIDSVVAISAIVNIGVGVITLAAVAFGTSLPEVLVSVKAAWKGRSEIALGNIFGSNVFNLLMVVGIPGLFSTLSVDEQTLSLGIPVLIAATVLFIISGISRRIHIWEGAMYLLIYVFFIGKLFGFL